MTELHFPEAVDNSMRKELAKCQKIAHWKFEDGQTVAADTQAIAPTGPAQTEFHILSPSPWPVGQYTVEVFVDTTSAGTRTFSVQ